MAANVYQQIEEIVTSPDRSLAYSNLLHIHRLSADDPPLMSALAAASPPLILPLLADINSTDEEIAAQALKCLGFMLYHPSLVPIFSEEVAGVVLESLASLIVGTRMKAICNLAVWCISIQQLGDGIVGSRINLLLPAVVHALDNPFGSLSTTFEAMQAVIKMASRFCQKMRNTSDIWVPPIYRRLVSIDKKERDMAERCLLKTKPIICPPALTLSKVVALDLKKMLLQSMLGMQHDCQQKLPMIQAWGWYICLLGSSSLKSRHLINEMLKIPEQTFTEPDPQVQVAALAAWEQLVDALLPPRKIDLEMNCGDKASGLLRRVKVLMMPLKGIISSRHCNSVHLSCLKTWHYLLHKLDVSVNHPSVMMASFWPILESIFSRGFDSMNSTSLWTSCLDLLEDQIRAKVGSGQPELSVEKTLSFKVDNVALPGSFVDYKGHLEVYPIKWLPWETCNLNFSFKMISLVLKQGLVVTVTPEQRNLAFSYSFRIFRLVLQGVQVEIKLSSTSYDRIQFCVTTILTFLKEVFEDMALIYHNKQCKDFLLLAFQFMEATREELDSSIFASPFYRVSSDLKYIKEMQLAENAENIEIEALKVSSLVYNDMVSPMVYTTILDLCLIAQSIQNLLTSQINDVSHAIKHIKILLFSASPLLNLQAAISFLYMHLTKHANGRFGSLVMWRIITKGLQEIIGSASFTFLNSECDGASTVICQLLSYPIVMLLYSPEISAYKSLNNSSDLCLVSSHREIEVDLMIEVWKSIFDSLCIGLQNKAFITNNYAEGLSQMLIRVLDDSIEMEIQCNTPLLLRNCPKIGFFMVFGELVICILKYAQVLHVEASGSDAINKEASSQNQGSPINNSLGLVDRFMKMSVKILNIYPRATHMIICRVFAALTCLVGCISSKQDVLLLMELMSDSLVQWLSWCNPVTEVKQRSSIMYHLQCVWTEILDCLQRSRPPIIFDSQFLGVQASLLQVALNHPEPRISDATIEFWNNTYSRNVELKYPQCLLPVLDKLSRSGRINAQLESQLCFASNSSAGKSFAGLSHMWMSELDGIEGHNAQACIDIVAPGFRRKRLKVTKHPGNFKGVKHLGMFNCCEGRPEHIKADHLLEKLRRV